MKLDNWLACFTLQNPESLKSFLNISESDYQIGFIPINEPKEEVFGNKEALDENKGNNQGRAKEVEFCHFGFWSLKIPPLVINNWTPDLEPVKLLPLVEWPSLPNFSGQDELLILTPPFDRPLVVHGIQVLRLVGYGDIFAGLSCFILILFLFRSG